MPQRNLNFESLVTVVTSKSVHFGNTCRRSHSLERDIRRLQRRFHSDVSPDPAECQRGCGIAATEHVLDARCLRTGLNSVRAMALVLPRTVCQRTWRHAVQFQDIRYPVGTALARMEFHSAAYADSRLGLEPGSACAPMRRAPLGDELVHYLFPFLDHQGMAAWTVQQVLQG